MPGVYRFIEDLSVGARARPMDDAVLVQRRFRDLRESLPAERVRAALDGERWRAAVETGVIERLYDVSPGVTEAIVRHGLDADEARGLDQSVFDQISAHRHSEDVVTDAVRAGTDLTTSLVKELHAAVTFGQDVYVGTDPLGRQVRLPLHHGTYKQLDNHVRLPDETLHEYAPAAHVDAEMDRLIELLARHRDVNPVTRAAFAHHRLTQIHPFEDGNGRTARLVATLELARGELLSLVVSRGDRNRYLASLRAADNGDLSALIDFLIEQQQSMLQRLETAALEAPADDLSAFADALAEYALRRRRASGTEDLKLALHRTGATLDDSLRAAIAAALAPFAARNVSTDVYPFENELLPSDSDEAGRAAADLPRKVDAAVMRVQLGFRIGDAPHGQIDCYIVPLQSLAANAFAVTAGHNNQEPLLVEGDGPEAPLRRWVDEVVGRVLTDYVRLLY